MSNAWANFDDWLTTEPNEEPDEETISDRIKYYMSEGKECDPYDWANFSETIYSASRKQADEMMDWAKHKNFEALGRYMWCMVQEEMEKCAENMAMDDYNKGLIGDDRE